MPIETLYPTKSLRYKICEFFFGLQEKGTGLGVPLLINIHDMAWLLGYATGDNGLEKIMAFRLELFSLKKERFGNSMDRVVIQIPKLPTLNEFKKAFASPDSEETLIVSCSTENLEDYIKELKKRTKIATQNKLYNGSVGLESLDNSRIQIVFDNKKININRSKQRSFNLSINIIKLMFGESVKDIRGNLISINDYKRGNHISFEEVLASLRKIEGVGNEESEIGEKSLKDAVRNLNKRSSKKFSTDLFEMDDAGAKWILGSCNLI